MASFSFLVSDADTIKNGSEFPFATNKYDALATLRGLAAHDWDPALETLKAALDLDGTLGRGTRILVALETDALASARLDRANRLVNDWELTISEELSTGRSGDYPFETEFAALARAAQFAAHGRKISLVVTL